MHHQIIDINKILSEGEAQGRRFGLEKCRDNKKTQFPNGVEEAISFIVQGAGAFVMTTNSWDHVAKLEIINILLDTKFEQNITVLPLLLDLKSTMLPWDVFNEERLQKYFHKQIWLSDSESSRTTRHALRIITKHATGLESNESSDMDELIELLNSSLSRVLYLIVF
ncbi:hypothetical protein PanWU01x14_249300 [Parasponia andersonii]|uniref:Uncharacterized protein n=1 Tax=Parasponia andersonii TaxID=3476 RepID=A0A2P5BD70_PARAD|nr:hypothetical protein PanWU01x14_249300 [Parasponia andersonii]